MQSSRSQMFFKIGVLKSFTRKKFHKKTPMLRLQHRCFPVKFAKFLITPFFTEHLRWLLLEMEEHFIFFPFFYYHDLAKCSVFKSFMTEVPNI